MATIYESVPELDAEARAETQAKLISEIEESDLIFIANDDGSWAARDNGVIVTVTPDWAHGTYRVDADTKVVIAPGREAALRAMANYLKGFTYKVANFWAVAPDGSLSWTAGSSIHYGYERKAGVETVESAVKRVSGTVPDCKEHFEPVNKGASLCDAANVANHLAQILRRMSE